MKILKSCLLIALTVISVRPLTAQHIAVAGGLNMSNVRTDLDENTFEERNHALPGGHVGMIFDIPVKNSFSIETGAFITTKGYWLKDDYTIYGNNIELRYRLRTFHFEVPLTVKYTWKLRAIDIYALAGPSLSVGLYGNTVYKYEGTGDDEIRTNDINWGSEDDDDLKRFDAGIKLGGGIRYKKISAGLFYNYGFVNTGNGFDMHNRVFGLTVGYWFGKTTE